jgi:hypothetical protein
MILHARFREQHRANKEVAVEDLSTIFRESRAEDCEIILNLVEQCIGDWANVAGVCGIKGRAVLEIEMPAACRSDEAGGGNGLPDCLGSLDRPRFQREDNGLGLSGLGREFATLGQADKKDCI